MNIYFLLTKEAKFKLNHSQELEVSVMFLLTTPWEARASRPHCLIVFLSSLA